MRKTKEFRNLNKDEIDHQLSELRKELMKENVHVFSGTAPSNPGKSKQLKKNIARLLTIKKEQEVRTK